MNQTNRKHLSVLEGLYLLLSTDSDLVSVTAAPAYTRYCGELALVLQEMGSEVVRQDAVEYFKGVLSHPSCRPFNMHEHAPIDEAVRDRLWRSVQSLPIKAACVNDSVDEAELLKAFCSKHFELGCWLHFYAANMFPGLVFDRIDCLRRIVAHEVDPKDIVKFQQVFGFGELHWSNLLAPTYLDQVLHPLRAIARAHPDEAYGLFFNRMGWQISLTASAAAA